VLDVSSAREAVSRQSQFHTMALVNLSAKIIESSYFLRHFENQWLLRFHLQAESVGLFSEGMLAFDGEGRDLCGQPKRLEPVGPCHAWRLLGLLGRSVFSIARVMTVRPRHTRRPAPVGRCAPAMGARLFAALRGLARDMRQPTGSVGAG
jgi:sigma-54 dependent transcriptional regulator, acetoin dehydrogenase operon transcriptional activator AcoR